MLCVEIDFGMDPRVKPKGDKKGPNGDNKEGPRTTKRRNLG